MDFLSDLMGEAVVNEERLLKLPQVSERLSLSRTAIYRLMAKGDLQPVRIGGALRFPASAIDRLIEDLKEENKEANHARAA
jgi:excisionase family DNA binding protein